MKEIGTKHTSASIRQTSKIIDEAVLLLLSLSVKEDLEGSDGLGFNDEKILEQVPPHLQSRVVKLSLVAVLKVKYKGVEG